MDLGLVHNTLVKTHGLPPGWLYSDSFLNSSFGPHHCVPESTSYTSLVDLDGDGTLIVHYDRLANGWPGPPGQWGDRDRTFSLRFRYQ